MDPPHCARRSRHRPRTARRRIRSRRNEACPRVWPGVWKAVKPAPISSRPRTVSRPPDRLRRRHDGRHDSHQGLGRLGVQRRRVTGASIAWATIRAPDRRRSCGHARQRDPGCQCVSRIVCTSPIRRWAASMALSILPARPGIPVSTSSDAVVDDNHSEGVHVIQRGSQ